MSAVYFIEAVETGHFKIGISVDPIRRHVTLQSQNPQSLILHCWMPVEGQSVRREAMAIERRFHERYLPFHHRSEWFWASALIRADVAAIIDGKFDIACLPTVLSEASLLRPISRGPRMPMADRLAA